MPNTYVNKLVVDGVTKLDLTGDTVTAEHLEQGYTAHDSSGLQITGTLDPGGVTPSGTLTVTANGTYDVEQYAAVTVAIPVYDGTVI